MPAIEIRASDIARKERVARHKNVACFKTDSTERVPRGVENGDLFRSAGQSIPFVQKNVGGGKSGVLL